MKTVNEDGKTYSIYRSKQFKEYVDKYIKVYVGYMGIKSKEYYDYSPGDIAKMIYEDYPKPPGKYIYLY